VIHKVYSPTCSGRHGGDRWGVRMEQSRAVDGRESGGWRRSEKEGVGVVRVVSLLHSAHIVSNLSNLKPRRHSTSHKTLPQHLATTLPPNKGPQGGGFSISITIKKTRDDRA
jgi:hypothetical protein